MNPRQKCGLPANATVVTPRFQSILSVTKFQRHPSPQTPQHPRRSSEPLADCCRMPLGHLALMSMMYQSLDPLLANWNTGTG